MNLKKFEYMNKDIPFIKKDIFFRLVYFLVFFGIFSWQFVSLISYHLKNNSVGILMLISSISIMILSLLFTFTSMMYMFKSLKILNVLKKRGRCVSAVQILFDTSKTSFVRLYTLLTQVLSIICIVVLVSSITYAILQFSYYTSISFFMPLLAFITISGFHTSYHIGFEIKTVKNVNMFNSIY